MHKFNKGFLFMPVYMKECQMVLKLFMPNLFQCHLLQQCKGDDFVFKESCVVLQ